MALGMSSCEVALTLIQYCFSSGCSLRNVAQREIDDVVIRILAAGKHALALGRDSNHGKQLTINIDFLAQGLLRLGNSSSAVSEPRTMTGE